MLSFATAQSTASVVDSNARTGATRWTTPAMVFSSNSVFGHLSNPQGPDVLVFFPGASPSKPSRLLAINEATGKTEATDLLPHTAVPMSMSGRTFDAITVIGGDALLEPEQVTCAYLP